jgi:hypothetical protein
MNNTEAEALLVDAHVHIYDCFDVNLLLDAASRNFRRTATMLGLEHGFTGVLLLAETSRDNWFLHPLMPGKHNHWKVEKTPDTAVLTAKPLTDSTSNKGIIYIMAGRQIITAEGLELLALATDSAFKDGLSVKSALGAVREKDAIPVLPWAAGKWLGKRGKLLSDLLKTEAHSDLCLGDNSGRPLFWHNPRHFRMAKKNKMRILPGTDPLPFAGEAVRVGSFGFMVRGKLTNTQPSSDLKKLLRNNTIITKAYGQLESPLRFVSNQIRLRIS